MQPRGRCRTGLAGPYLLAIKLAEEKLASNASNQKETRVWAKLHGFDGKPGTGMSWVKRGHLGSSLKGSKLPTLRKGGHSSIVSDRSSVSSATKYLNAYGMKSKQKQIGSQIHKRCQRSHLAVSKAVRRRRELCLESQTFTFPSSWPDETHLKCYRW